MREVVGREGAVKSLRCLVKVITMVGGKKLPRRRSRDGRKMHPNIYSIALDPRKILDNINKIPFKIWPQGHCKAGRFRVYYESS